MDWSVDWNLRLRMLLAVALLFALAAAFVGVVAGILAAAAEPFGLPRLVAPALATLLLVGLATLELRQRDHVVRGAGAVDVDAETDPRLHRTVTSVAQQADVPVPTLAVAKTETPEAFTAGFRPSTTTFVVSTGLLDELDDEELRAVVAHELAHVKNRDVAVMTAVSLPTAIAERLYDLGTSPTGETTLENWEYRSDGKRESKSLVGFVAATVGWLFALVGRVVVAIFSRTRELAADRGAVVITGDPAALASALSKIERRLRDRPTDDLRATASVSAFSVVSPASVDEVGDEPIRLGVDGDRAATYHHRWRRMQAFVGHYLQTHPPVADRRERLKRLARER
ncbi:heat shock protein HtpX [Halogranum amylolyticum]|uniref:Heat shock protein HtpX n=1 Tax=Halogranum amylolyticum TaxID=660520 RepID=A0A1H8S5N6_9EURY|nr:M48 family metalloprotease [Halogranum amylolyticum]SEO73473.1 heat shock protein HtpX [Halogranum amylolyticum]